MNKNKLLKGCAAFAVSALMATSGIAALPVSAATTSSASAVSADAVAASFSALSAYKINLTQCFSTLVSVSSGKANYTYKFGYKKDGVTTYVSTKTSASPYYTYNYTFTEAGSYVPVVQITDANNTKVVKQLSTVTVKDFKAGFYQTSSNKILVSDGFSTAVSLSGGKGTYTYRYGYILNGKTTYLSPSTSGSTQSYYTYKFPAPGTYTPIVEVTDADGVKATNKLVDVIVKDFVVNFGKVAANFVNVNYGFSTTASVSGGKAPYTFKYSYKVNGKTTTVSTQTTDAPYVYYTYKFPAEGSCTPIVEVTDADGVRTKSSLEAVTVKNFKADFSKVSAPYVNINTGFSTTTSVSGGKATYTYKFGYTVNGTTKYVSTQTTAAPYVYYTYKFPAAGSYSPFVEVADADGVRIKTILSETVTVKDFKANFSKISAPYVNVNTGFSTATSVSGGKATYTYKFGYTVNGTTKYVSTQTTGSPYVYYTFKFPEAGTYTPFVEVADGDGVRVKTVLSEPVTVKDFRANFSKVSAPYVNVNTGFSTSTSVSGGKATYTYKFGYTVNGTTKYVSTQTTGAPYVYYTFKFPAAGTYTPFVEVADADGVRVKTSLSETVTVKDFKADFSKISAPYVNVNTGFSTSTSVSGGKATYTYKFGYTIDGTTKYVSTQTTGSPYVYYTFKFPAAGTYTPFVEVADADGVRVKTVLSETVTVKDFKADFSRISAPVVKANVGFSTATSVSGGRGAYTYKFGYTVNGTTKYVSTQTTGAPYVYYTYKFPTAGTYTPFVEVADGDGVRVKTILSETVTVQ